MVLLSAPGIDNNSQKEKHMADNLGLHLSTEHEGGQDWPKAARDMVRDWAVHGLGVPVSAEFYVVWFAFILGGWKALISSTEPDGRYYEVTFNKAQGEAYLDTYRKTHNHATLIIPPGKDIL